MSLPAIIQHTKTLTHLRICLLSTQQLVHKSLCPHHNPLRYMSRMPTKNDKKNKKLPAAVKQAKLQKSRNEVSDDNTAELLNRLKFDAIEDKMDLYVDNLRTALSTIKVGRAAPNALDTVTVNVYNKKQRLSELGQISIRNNNTLAIQLYDTEIVQLVEAAIKQYNNDLNPQYDPVTKSLSVQFPKVTRDTRDMLMKQVSKHIEQTKLNIRAVRQDALQRCKNVLRDASSDDVDSVKQEIQAVMDECLLEIDNLVKQKEKELSE